MLALSAASAKDVATQSESRVNRVFIEPSDQFRLPGDANRIRAARAGLARRLHVVSALLRLWRISEVRCGDLLPCDFHAGVTGNLTHDRGQRAADHVVAVVDRVSRADGGEELVV